MTASMIHFWLPNAPPAAELRTWDPDSEPWRYASGVGHNLVELWSRLRDTGLDVSIGSDVPRPTSLLVVFLKSAFEKQPPRRRSLRDALAAVQAARGRFVLIRSDAPPEWQFPVRPLREFVPTRSLERYPWQRWLPPLPQRGLRPRDPSRRGRIRSVAWKGNPPSVHPDLVSVEWRDAVSSRGLDWILDMPGHTDGSDQRWHDFSDVDALLCFRTPEHVRRWGAGKPPTRLINAWAAGAVPLVAREEAYLELARDGEDAVICDSVWDALDAIERLENDPKALARVEEGGVRRAVELSTEHIVDSWAGALLEAAYEPQPGATGRRAQALSIAWNRASLGMGEALLPSRRRVRAVGAQVRARIRTAVGGRRRIGLGRGGEHG